MLGCKTGGHGFNSQWEVPTGNTRDVFSMWGGTGRLGVQCYHYLISRAGINDVDKDGAAVIPALHTLL